MAENQEQMEPKEREIPVFTVLKNNCILKNIFLLDNPPSMENFDRESEIEEVLLVGRHPDCNIKLEHPSISRFHLRVHSKPSSRSLFVTDLSSVHGTWVSGKRIEPRVTVTVNKGDTLQLGASSRLYRVDWVPLSRAYDIDDPFVPPLDAMDTLDEETEVALDQDEHSVSSGNNQGKGLNDDVESLQRLFSDDDIGLSMQELSPTAPPIPGDLCDPFSYKDEVENDVSPEIYNKENEPFSSQIDYSVTVDEEGAKDQDEGQGLTDEVMEGLESSPTAPPIPEDLCDHFYYKYEVENDISPEIYNKENEPFSSQVDGSVTVDEEGAKDQDEEQVLTDEVMEGLELLFSDEKETQSVFEDSYHSFEEQNNSPEICIKEIEQENSTPKSHMPVAVSQTISEAENTEFSGMNSEKRSGLSIWSRRGKSKSVKIETSQSRGKSIPDKNCLSESILKDHRYASPDNDDETFTPDKENTTPNSYSYLVRSLKGKFEETLKGGSISNSPNSELFTPDKENVTPDSHLLRTMKNVGRSGEVKRLNSYRPSPLKIASNENVYHNEVLVPKASQQQKFEETLKGELISTSPNSEIFTPDKENVTPDSHLLLRSMKNIRKSGEVKRLNSYRPSPLKIANNENASHNEVLVPKASQHQKVLQESKSTFSSSESHKKQQPALKARANREPFHPLPVISSRDHNSDSINSVHESTMRSCRSIKNLESEDVNQSYKNATKVVTNNSWTIVADTTCLLNRKSRNELQLLRGLRGTTLVIPRVVVRELDCMLRRASIFARLTEASAALNWIEECMAETKWWIHIQSSAEEGRLVPPTPPAASYSSRWFTEEKSPFSVASIPFSPYTLEDIVTPTPADHVLDYALLSRRATNGQLVLLSDDVTLKIKAMAEGVICETAEEFRGSLVNPFSPRFLYSNSSPVGPTWSCSDDTVLKENYYPSPGKKTSKSEGVKGLKLILLHNSSFRQIAY